MAVKQLARWCNAHVKAVLYEAPRGEDRFPAGQRALLRWFQSGRNRLGRMKKVWLLSNWLGGVMVTSRLWCTKPKEASIDSQLGQEHF